jgi:hypothetical protein
MVLLWCSVSSRRYRRRALSQTSVVFKIVDVCVECGITIPDTHVLLGLTPKQLTEAERKYRTPCIRLEIVDDPATITCTEIGAAAPLNPSEQA